MTDSFDFSRAMVSQGIPGNNHVETMTKNEAGFCVRSFMGRRVCAEPFLVCADPFLGHEAIKTSHFLDEYSGHTIG